MRPQETRTIKPEEAGQPLEKHPMLTEDEDQPPYLGIVPSDMLLITNVSLSPLDFTTLYRARTQFQSEIAKYLASNPTDAARIKFKTLVMVYESINGTAPRCLQDLIILYTPARLLRSSTSARLAVPRTKGRKGSRFWLRRGGTTSPSHSDLLNLSLCLKRVLKLTSPMIS
ncbi:hypothetical protein Z043_112966 [Scleropages formosus]|uniref:Uncharacterized protein n=1 Tax=Scleropages formosus TaxID=113540 RepID=A0A0P7UJF2_SCLFO|nr:hypothetical protein Z043_112966 [Scleropages formosus]